MFATMKLLVCLLAFDLTKKIAYNQRNHRVNAPISPKSIKISEFYPSFLYPYANAKHRGTKIKAQQIGAAWLGEHRGTKNKGPTFLRVG